jgi:Coenzyme PQQ synthesis protein D (PqqD)
MSVQLAQDVSVAETDHGAVLLDSRRGRYWQLNTTGVVVLRVLLDGGTAEQAAGQLVRTLAVPADRAAADVTAFLATLRAAKVVR